MPESGKPTLKTQLASEVAHIRQTRPDIAVVAVADGAPDNWTFLESLSPEAEAVDFWHGCEHLGTASDHAVDPRWFETYRHVLRHDPHGVAKVIRALRYLRDRAGNNRAARNAVERKLAFFRGRRSRTCRRSSLATLANVPIAPLRLDSANCIGRRPGRRRPRTRAAVPAGTKKSSAASPRKTHRPRLGHSPASGPCAALLIARPAYPPPPSWSPGGAPPTRPGPTCDTAPGCRSGGTSARPRSRGSRPACGARGRDRPPHA